MSDIAKCPGLQANGEPCPWRDTCWLYLAPISKKQAWADIKWWPERGYCHDYEPVS